MIYFYLNAAAEFKFLQSFALSFSVIFTQPTVCFIEIIFAITQVKFVKNFQLSSNRVFCSNNH